MIGNIRSLCTKLLYRILPPTEVGRKLPIATRTPTLHRRVEVTVERETVSVLVRSPLPEGAQGSTREEAVPETPVKELPPPALSPDLRAAAPALGGPDKNHK